MARIYLSSSDTIVRCENNLVTLTLADGTVYERLEPRRLFPVSRENEYITLLNESGVEIAVIRSITDVDKSAQDVLNDSLDDYYLVPHITRIISTAEKFGTLRWTVETDRGIKTFDIRNRNHDISILAEKLNAISARRKKKGGCRVQKMPSVRRKSRSV